MNPEGEATDATQERRGFFARRWAGLVRLRLLFWRDMALYGTLINAVTSLASLILFAEGAPDWLALGVFLLPLPYNLFLTTCIWRTADRQASASFGGMAKLGSVIWLFAASIL